MPSYRIIDPLTALLCKDSREHIGMLGRGVIVITLSTVDRAGLIEAACDGRVVRIFERDLLERSERIDLDDTNSNVAWDVTPCL